MLRLPNVPTTPAQWSEIARTTAIVLTAVGAVAFYYSRDAGAADAELLRRIGFGSFALAAAVLLLKRLVTAYLN